MSRKRYDYCSCKPAVYSDYGCQSKGGGLGLAALVILILIILQFKKDERCEEDYDRDYDEKDDRDYEDYDECDEDDDEDDHKRDHDNIVDNGILFIITIFFLACCSKKRC